MGRFKKYFSEEEKKEANKAKSHKYYLKNSEQIKKKSMKKYYERKNMDKTVYNM